MCGLFVDCCWVLWDVLCVVGDCRAVCLWGLIYVVGLGSYVCLCMGLIDMRCVCLWDWFIICVCCWDLCWMCWVLCAVLGLGGIIVYVWA